MRYYELFENDMTAYLEMRKVLRSLIGQMSSAETDLPSGMWRDIVPDGHHAASVECLAWGHWNGTNLTDDCRRALHWCLEKVSSKFPNIRIHLDREDKGWLLFRVTTQAS